MAAEGEAEFVFVCEACDVRVFVDEAVRSSLLSAGECVVCGAPISADQLDRNE